MSFIVSYACVCNQGLKRKINQDNFICGHRIRDLSEKEIEDVLFGTIVPGYSAVFAIFDGMSGEQRGEQASFLSAKTFQGFREWSEKKDCVLDACEKANNSICQYMVENQLSSMGSTAAIIRFAPEEIEVCNVGDSRVYQLSENELLQKSVDHVLAFWGQGKPPLYQYLGIPRDEMLLEPYTTSCQYSDNDIYLICSDGLTDLVTTEEIRQVLTTYEEKEAARKLLSKTLERGGTDNITFMIFSVREEEKGTMLAQEGAKLTQDEAKFSQDEMESSMKKEVEQIDQGNLQQNNKRIIKALCVVVALLFVMVISFLVGVYTAPLANKDNGSKSDEKQQVLEKTMPDETESKESMEESVETLEVSETATVEASTSIAGDVYLDELSSTYLSAKKIYENGQYAEARDIFFSLEGYSDSTIMVDQCTYQIAMDLLDLIRTGKS